MIKIHQISPDGEKEVPIPPIPGFFKLDRARLFGRLESTRAGNNYSWLASRPLRELMNAAPFQPYLDVLLEDVEVYLLGFHKKPEHPNIRIVNIRFVDDPQSWSGERWGAVNEDIRPYWVIWGGSLVDSPAFVMAAKAEDCTFRKDRQDLFDSLYMESNSKPLYQGHLEVKHISKFKKEDEDYWRWQLPEKFEHLVHHPNRPVILYNHAVFAESVVALDNQRLVYIKDPHYQGLITSPDHPLESVQLGEGWWLLQHPVPAGRVD